MRKLVLHCALLIGIIVFIEYAINTSVRRTLWDNWKLGQRMQQAEERSAYDVIFLGDSTADQNIIEEEFDAVSGLQSLNLATNANANAVADLYYMHTYLSRNPPPEAFVSLRSYKSWYTPINKNMYEYLPPRILISLRLHLDGYRTLEDFLHIALMRVLPSVRYRPYARTLIEERIEWLLFQKGIPKKLSHEERALRKEKKRINQFVTEELIEYELGVIEDTREAFLKRKNPFAEKTQLLRYACRLAEKNNSVLLLTWSPPVEDFEEYEIVMQAKEEQNQIMRSLIMMEPGCDVLTLSKKDIHPSLMRDAIHTTPEGSIPFSHMLAQDYARYEKGGYRNTEELDTLSE